MQHLTQQAVDFWLAKTTLLDWHRAPDQVHNYNQTSQVHEWFADGQLNACYNCLDRHLDSRANQTAVITVNESNQVTEYSYQELTNLVCQTATTLKQLGITKGDVVTLYLRADIWQVVCTLACARIGAIHSAIFAGFSADQIAGRMAASNSKLLISSASTTRRGNKIDLLSTAREAIAQLPNPAQLAVIGSNNASATELDLEELVDQQPSTCPIEVVDALHPLFILYTSGTTGQPKGIIHSTGGYLTYAAHSNLYSFELGPGQIHWCTADLGWITGHTYQIYGPLALGATTVIAEGAPDFPTADRWWQVIEKIKATVFYTAPTALRLLKAAQTQPQNYDLSSLQILGSVGEPLNPVVGEWFAQTVGQGQLPVIDTWWQTETGGHLLATHYTQPQKLGKTGLPLPHITPVVVDDQGAEVPSGQKGLLVFTTPWPGMLQGCLHQPDRYQKYWWPNTRWFVSGDYAIKDSEGYIQVVGRSDDVIKVAGHRIGSAELENVLLTFPEVSEVGVVGVPDQVKGEKIIAFVVTTNPISSTELLPLLNQHLKSHYGSHAQLAQLIFKDSLPKTRSGKIKRRLLRAEV